VAPQTGTVILVLAAFVLPGFVTVLLRERTYRIRAGSDPFELLLTALSYSAVIYLAASVSDRRRDAGALRLGLGHRLARAVRPSPRCPS
jgi:hypothetical protein